MNEITGIITERETLLPLANKHLRYINPVQLGSEICESKHSFGPAIREYWLLHYVVSGCGEFTVGNKTYRVGAGECFVIRPYESTFYIADGKTPWTYIWAGFTAETEIPEALLRSDVINAAGYGRIFADMLSCGELENREEYIAGRLLELLLLIGNSEQKRSTEASMVSAQIKNYIESNYMKKLSVNEIAERFHFNRCYMSTLFRKENGVSPQRYLCDFRLNKALFFLCELRLSPGETATAVGYGDICMFSRMFSKRFGYPPSEAIRRKGEADGKDG